MSNSDPVATILALNSKGPEFEHIDTIFKNKYKIISNGENGNEKQ
jgi:hypothetical protein